MLNDWGGQQLAHLPGRKPVIGDVASIRSAQPLQSVMEQCTDLGPIFELKVFGQKYVFVSGAGLAAELNDEKRFEKALSPALNALREFAGAGLFTAYNDETDWDVAHTLLMPAFSKAAMQRYHPIMLEVAAELFESWNGGEGPVDVSADMTRLTLETISRTAFSTDFGSFTRDDPHPFVGAMIAALKAAQRKGSLRAMPGGRLVSQRIDQRNAHHQAYVDDLLDGIIAERRASGPGEHDDLLGIMLDSAHPQTGARLDDVNIRHQILTFLVAGHETTSGALSFALYYLARHPEALAKAQAEVDEVLGSDRSCQPTFDQVAKFRYIRRVLDEGLRLWPTAPAYGRTPREETTLSTGHTMRPGDWALIVLPMTHRDTSAWGDDAAEFDPDRFDRGSHGRTPSTFKPFGTGERACIGRQFALHEAVLVLAMLLHRHDLAGDPDYVLKIAERLTLMPQGFELTFTPR